MRSDVYAADRAKQPSMEPGSYSGKVTNCISSTGWEYQLGLEDFPRCFKEPRGHAVNAEKFEQARDTDSTHARHGAPRSGGGSCRCKTSKNLLPRWIS